MQTARTINQTRDGSLVVHVAEKNQLLVNEIAVCDPFCVFFIQIFLKNQIMIDSIFIYIDYESEPKNKIDNIVII